ncbi:hypothetical protein M404DRAFT_995722 [Pisolithus tinctorius Marx 270]|uniref:Uncharacterized protein n=1 Tax=Pisolithus tinctorius Marx 270 TaxID=870435 RepID=A0A0C3PNS8_PISTI|nr:hypothetical protein M404DRAFT_995722 [Pisolithus tinctorius Marx 270]
MTSVSTKVAGGVRPWATSRWDRVLDLRPVTNADPGKPNYSSTMCDLTSTTRYVPHLVRVNNNRQQREHCFIPKALRCRWTLHHY